jgi:hypothetical protein
MRRITRVIIIENFFNILFNLTARAPMSNTSFEEIMKQMHNSQEIPEAENAYSQINDFEDSDVLKPFIHQQPKPSSEFIEQREDEEKNDEDNQEQKKIRQSTCSLCGGLHPDKACMRP